MADDAVTTSIEELKELLMERELNIYKLQNENEELKKENDFLMKCSRNPNEQLKKFLMSYRLMEQKIKEDENILKWHLSFQDELCKKLEDAENRNKFLTEKLNEILKHKLHEQQLQNQLVQAKAVIKELEIKKIYPSAIKKDSDGNPITDELIIQLYSSGMNPNKISKQTGLTHQAIRARLKKLGLYEVKNNEEKK